MVLNYFKTVFTAVILSALIISCESSSKKLYDGPITGDWHVNTITGTATYTAISDGEISEEAINLSYPTDDDSNYSVIGGGGLNITGEDFYIRISETAIQEYSQYPGCSFLDGWDGTIVAGKKGEGSHTIDEYRRPFYSTDAYEVTIDSTTVRTSRLIQFNYLVPVEEEVAYTIAYTESGIVLEVECGAELGEEYTIQLKVKITMTIKEDESFLDNAMEEIFWEFS